VFVFRKVFNYISQKLKPKIKKVNLKKMKAMYAEARKISLIEEVLKINNDNTLTALETTLMRSRKKATVKKPSIYDFVGILTKKEAYEMRKAIEETCETINLNEWK
jgi:hypothetical protein